MAKLAEIPDNSVQCVVTSPPYWGLRDYGTAAWAGGDVECEHTAMRRGHGEDEKQATSAGTSRDPIRGWDCRLCGATRIDSQIGLEKTPEEYTAKLVAVFREARRVLRKDGVCFVNLGDSYYGSWANYSGGDRGAGKQRPIVKGSQAQNPVWEGLEEYRPAATFKHEMLKPKDLVGIPWRVAFALQADGWWLRSDIIWAKPNPMPESVTDRPTKSHEYIFLLTKSANYYFDQDAVREPHEEPWRSTGKPDRGAVYAYAERHAAFNKREYNPAGRNIRTVWNMATQPYSDAHFATFPEELPKRCILAGSKPGDIVLDPFGGSGTVGKVALELGRRAILIELNPEYVEMIERRCRVTMGFNF
jgi:DNA modification methylase